MKDMKVERVRIRGRSASGVEDVSILYWRSNHSQRGQRTKTLSTTVVVKQGVRF